MKEKIILLLLSFALITVGGTVIGSILQTRSWKHQEKVKFYEELSSIIDQRIYALYQICWGFNKNKLTEEELSKKFDERKEKIDVFMNNLNRYENLLEFYYNKSLRDTFKYDIQLDYIKVGDLLNDLYKNYQKELTVDRSSCDPSINKLNIKVTKFNKDMLNELY